MTAVDVQSGELQSGTLNYVVFYNTYNTEIFVGIDLQSWNFMISEWILSSFISVGCWHILIQPLNKFHAYQRI